MIHTHTHVKDSMNFAISYLYVAKRTSLFANLLSEKRGTKVSPFVAFRAFAQTPSARDERQSNG